MFGELFGKCFGEGFEGLNTADNVAINASKLLMNALITVRERFW